LDGKYVRVCQYYKETVLQRDWGDWSLFARAFLPGKRCPGANSVFPIISYHGLPILSIWHIAQIFGPLGLHNKLTVLLCPNICSHCPWGMDTCTYRTDRPSTRGGHVSVWQLQSQLRLSAGRGHLYTSCAQLLSARGGQMYVSCNLQVYITSLQICATFTNFGKIWHEFLSTLRIDFFENLWYNIYRK
jgi:hypothetical protein